LLPFCIDSTESSSICHIEAVVGSSSGSSSSGSNSYPFN
jgi:hypothetical protein